MKFHKIRGVEKSVCTAEQKIAYNFAFADREWILRSGTTLDEYMIYTAHRLLHNEKISKRYDIDAIQHCLRQGIVEYCKSKEIILTSYEQIGKVFPSLYPVE